MIIFSIGTPGRLADWCDALTARLAESAFGAVHRAALNTLDELAVAILGTRAPHMVACSRQPVVRLQTEIIRGRRPFLVAISDPRTALRSLSQRAGYDLVAATRAVASSYAAMLSLTRAPGALVLFEHDIADPAAAAAAVADHFALSPATSDIPKIASELWEPGIAPDRVEDDVWWNELNDRERSIVNGALLPYVSHLHSDTDLRAFVWEPDLFFIFEDPPAASAVPAVRPVDITGRARVLIYGPFINLPPGSWSATVMLGCSEETAGMSFAVEVFAGRRLSHTQIEPAGEQIVESNLFFKIDESVDQPIQIRVISERPAFDGRLALGYTTVAPQAPIPPATRDHLTAALRR